MKLSKEDADQFYRLMWGLQFFVGQQRRLIPEVKSLPEYVTAPSATKIMVRDAVWANADLIDAYVAKNPEGFPAAELNVIHQWKRFVAGKFVIHRYLKDYAVFLGNSEVYGVLGLNDAFDVMVAPRRLPVMVETVLLPYQGKVIYDGIFRPYSLAFGSGMRSGFNEQYSTAKQNGRIITSLEPERAPVEPARQRRELDQESERIVAEIGKMSEKLRGGTVIQSAALGVLRAGAKVAQSAAQEPDDLEELWRLGRQVQSALKRLQTALERAEK
jgi:hypothetical protein